MQTNGVTVALSWGQESCPCARCISPKARVVGAESYGRPKTSPPRTRAQRKKSAREEELTSESQKSLFRIYSAGASRAPKRPQTPRCQKRLKIGALAEVSTTIIALCAGLLGFNHTTTHRSPRCRRSVSNSGIPPSEKRIPRHLHVCSHTPRDVVRQTTKRREWLAACQLPEQSLYSSVYMRQDSTTLLGTVFSCNCRVWAGGKNRRLVDAPRSDQYSMTGHLVSELGGGKSTNKAEGEQSNYWMDKKSEQ